MATKGQLTKQERKPLVVPAKKIGEVKGFGNYYELDDEYTSEVAGYQLIGQSMNSREWLMAYRNGIKIRTSRGGYGGMVGDCLVTHPGGEPVLIVRDALKHLPDWSKRNLKGLEKVMNGKKRRKYDRDYDDVSWESDLELNDERLTKEEYSQFKKQGLEDRKKDPEERGVFLIERSEMKTSQAKIRAVMFSRGCKTRLGDIWQLGNILYGDLKGELPRFLFRDKLPELLSLGDPERDYFETHLWLQGGYPRISCLDIECENGPGFNLGNSYGLLPRNLFSKEYSLTTEISNPLFLKHVEATRNGYESYAHMQGELRKQEKERRQEEARAKTLARIVNLCKKNKVSLGDLSEILEPPRRKVTTHTESQGEYEDRILREAYRIRMDRRDDPNRSF